MSIAPIQRPFRVLFSPRAVFESIRDDVRWEWLVALLLLATIGVGVGSILVPKVDFETYIQTQLEKRDANMSQEDMDRVVAMQGKFTGVFIRFVQPLLMGPIVYLLVSLLLWVLLKLVGGEAKFSVVFTVYMHALMPLAVASLLWIPVLLPRESVDMEAVQGGRILASNLGWLAPPGTGVAVKALLASFDIFSIWIIWLLSMGLSVAGRVSRTAATSLAVGVWVVWILIKVGLAAIGG